VGRVFILYVYISCIYVKQKLLKNILLYSIWLCTNKSTLYRMYYLYNMYLYSIPIMAIVYLMKKRIQNNKNTIKRTVTYLFEVDSMLFEEP